MKTKYRLFCAISQLVIGILAIAAFAIVGLHGENMTKWIVTLILAVAYIVFGIWGIVDSKSDK